MSIKQDFLDVNRLRHIVNVLFEEGFGYLLVKLKLDVHLPFTKRVQAQFTKLPDSLEERLTRVMIRLGPTFVKLGQALSLRPDLIPESYVLAFEKLQDKVDSFAFSDVKRILEIQYKKPLSEIFLSFDETPVASASLAQVHRAVLNDKSVVAVKVQRPGIQEIIATDIDIMRKLVWLFESHHKETGRKLQRIVDEFERWIKDELDFVIEANNARVFRKELSPSKHLIIPKVYAEYSTRTVLVTEFIEGVELNSAEKYFSHKEMIYIINIIYDSILTQAFINGTFHADPHPGNIIITKQKKVCFVDFGIVGHLDDKLKSQLGELFIGITNNDKEMTFHALAKITNAPADDMCRRDMLAMLTRINFDELDKINLSALLNDSFKIINHYQLRVPIDLVLFSKMVALVEGLGLRYNPQFNFMVASKPFTTKLLHERTSPKQLLKKTRRVGLQYKNLLEELPEDTLAIIDRLKNGQLKIDIEDRDLKNITLEIEHSSGNLSLGMIIAALVVGSALIFNASGGRIFSITGLVIAFLLSLWLIKRTIFLK